MCEYMHHVIYHPNHLMAIKCGSDVLVARAQAVVYFQRVISALFITFLKPLSSVAECLPRQREAETSAPGPDQRSGSY